MSDDEQRRAVRILGRVQGVGFRWWAWQTAQELGVRGTVRNAPDGSVEVRMAGPGEALDRFLEALRSGPPAARVERVQDASLPDGELPASFEIVR
ncbi:MAG TPA: acylphosphatase [Longimicrobiales bacterium]|nr:acylphosphatase [Longimicrobiales bacterium]